MRCDAPRLGFGLGAAIVGPAVRAAETTCGAWLVVFVARAPADLLRLSICEKAPAAADVPRRALACVLVQVLGPRAAAAAAVEALNAAVLAAGGDALRIVAERAPSSAVCQWEDAVRGGGGVWDGAEAVVRSRLAAAKTAAKAQA